MGAQVVHLRRVLRHCGRVCCRLARGASSCVSCCLYRRLARWCSACQVWRVLLVLASITLLLFVWTPGEGAVTRKLEDAHVASPAARRTRLTSTLRSSWWTLPTRPSERCSASLWPVPAGRSHLQCSPEYDCSGHPSRGHHVCCLVCGAHSARLSCRTRASTGL